MRSKTNAFTLIELLVVVAIIALLMSILLPSLSGARRMARTVACAANFRSIDQAMVIYASEWSDAILGNGRTSNSALLKEPDRTDLTSSMVLGTDANMPAGIIQPLDWMTGVARVMRFPFDEGTDKLSRMKRFHQLAGGVAAKDKINYPGFKVFRCLENDIIAKAFPTAETNDHPMISYNTALGFQYRSGTGTSGTLSQFNINYITIPSSFRNKINQVGAPASKVFMAEGGRWWHEGSTSVTTTLTIGTDTPGGMSADYGPWINPEYARSYCYQSKSVDGRSFSMRHGSRNKGAPYGSMRMNLAFFDGHVETMNGIDAANPHLWAPTGTIIPKGQTHTLSDPGYKEITQRYWGSTDLVVR